jgi:hypothetical protein
MFATTQHNAVAFRTSRVQQSKLLDGTVKLVVGFVVAPNEPLDQHSESLVAIEREYQVRNKE